MEHISLKERVLSWLFGVRCTRCGGRHGNNRHSWAEYALCEWAYTNLRPEKFKLFMIEGRML